MLSDEVLARMVAGFSAQERRFLVDFYEREGSFANSFEHNLKIWAHLIESLKAGYGLNRSDWSNSLSYRQLLARLIEAAPYPASGRIRTIVEELDAAFDATTQPAKKPVPWTPWLGRAAWASRVPLRFSDDDFERFLRDGDYL